MTKHKEKNFLVQGSILAIAGVVTKIIGLIYRIPLNNIAGNEGMGYYSAAFSIYTVALMLTSYSLPLAVSKLVSERIGKGQYKNAYKVFREALAFALVAGGFVSLLIFFGADFIASTLLSMDMCAYSLRVLAPCILIVALLGVFRGFFQGTGSMVPTAISQILEQIVNAIASVAGAYMLLQAGKNVAKKMNDSSYSYSYAAAGGTIGTVAGAFFALLLLLAIFFAYKKIFKKQMRKDPTKEEERYRMILKILIATIIPVILSATVYNISDLLDTAIFNKIMVFQGYEKSEYASLLGMFSGKFTTLINVPTSVASALASSLIPALVMTAQSGSRKQIHGKIFTVIRFTMLISIPCAVGFLVLAKPILDVLFTRDNVEAAWMLQLGAISVVFFSLSTVTTAVIQGLDDMMTPVKNSAISLVVHIIALVLMMVVFQWNIYAVVMSKTIFALVNTILNDHTLRMQVGYVQETRKTFLLPTIASAIMGLVALVVHLVFQLFTGETLATLLAIVAAAITYGVSLFLIGAVTEADLREMPKGTLIISICKKLHLIQGEF